MGSSVFDLNGLKERIRTILSDANTTTATYPLSANMDSSVKLIGKYNPDMVFTQVSQFPSIHIYPDSKTLDLATIARDQLNANRQGVLKMNIMGACSHFNIDNLNEDKGQKNVEFLMENIELNLRAEPTFQGFTGVRWHFPSDVQYGVAAFEEDTYFRVGILTLDINLFY